MRAPVRVRAVRRAAWAMSCVPPGSDNGDAGVDVRLCNIQYINISYGELRRDWIRIRYTEQRSVILMNNIHIRLNNIRYTFVILNNIQCSILNYFAVL